MADQGSRRGLLPLTSWVLCGLLARAAFGQPPESPPSEGLLAPSEPAAASAAPALPTVPESERTSFQLPFPEERGGGVAAGTAGKLELERDKKAVLSGGVELRYKDLKLTADTIEVDLATRIVVATGNVTIDQGPQRLTGATAVFDVEAKTGKLTQATASVSPEIYFQGEELAKLAENLYSIERGVITSCTDSPPDWSFSVRKAKVELEGYAHLSGAAMRVKDVPVFYVPRLIWPAKRERASGFLVPQPGYSNRQGASLSLAYFQTLGRSYDATVYTDLYSKDYFGFGSELRYAPTDAMRGELNAYFVDDPVYRDPRDPGDDASLRWKLTLDHTSDRLPFGMRGALSFRDYSDFDYLRDFERNFDRGSIRSIYSRGFASGNWGQHSLNVVADVRETLVDFNPLGQPIIVTQRRLPKIDYSLRPTRLGRTPFYFNLDSSLAYLDLARSLAYSGEYGRLDLAPNLRSSVLSLPWMSVTLNAGGRYTWYGDSLCRLGVATPEDSEGTFCGAGVAQTFTGETLERVVPTGSAELIGPSFSRIYDKGLGKFGKFKHIIEPRISYSFVGEVDKVDSDSTPFFDEVDGVGTTNIGRVALVNRLLGKPATGRAGAREILSLEIARAYSFDEDVPLSVVGGERDAWGPITTLLRFEPGGPTRLRAQFVYNTQAKVLTQRSITAGFGWRGALFETTFLTRVSAQNKETQDDQARFWGTVPLLQKRLGVQAQVTYNLNDGFVQQQQLGVSYASQCFSYQLSAREFRTRRQQAPGQFAFEFDRDIRFLLTLKNVGTFLDLSSRDSTADEN